jgi:hypothetical protein
MTTVNTHNNKRRPIQAERQENGQFVRRRDPFLYYEIARVVAEEAARRDSNPLKDPRTVVRQAWNSARAAYESYYDHIPQMNEIQRQLSDYDGRPIGYRDLLELSFKDEREIRKIHEQRLAAPERALDDRDIERFLLFAGNRLSHPTVLPDDYVELRESVIAAAPTPLEAEALARWLPTRAQIERAAETGTGRSK